MLISPVTDFMRLSNFVRPDESKEVNAFGLIDETRATNLHMKQDILDTLVQRGVHNERSNKLPREVELYFYLWRVHNVDTVSQSFKVDITFNASWIEDNVKVNITPSLDESPDWTSKDFLWHPQIHFRNVIEEDDLVNDEWFHVTHGGSRVSKQYWQDNIEQLMDSDQAIRVTHHIRKKFTLSETFELQNFPFDLQPLHIHIGTSWDVNNVLLRFSDTIPSAIDQNPFDSQEWELSAPRLIDYNMECKDDDLPLLSLSEQSVSGVRYSRAYVALMVKRKPQSYLWNIYVMLLILGSLTFTVFSVSPDDTGDRLGILLTLVLALVAFKLVLAQFLPSISYLTMLDVYTLASTMLMFFISMFASILPHVIMDADALFIADKVILVMSAIMWIIVNLWFIVKMMKLTWDRESKIKDINASFKRYLNTISTKHSQMKVSSKRFLGYKPLRTEK